ncbi:MAG: diguanylate cyclase domain-containing protein [Bacillota bacterium]
MKNRHALQVGITYAIFGSLWILITDWVVDGFFDDFRFYSTIKGLIFIFLSTTVIYFSVLLELKKRREIEVDMDKLLEHDAQVKTLIKEQKERLFKLIDEAPMPMMLHAENKKIIRVSQALLDETGYTRHEIPTVKAWINLAYPNDVDHMHDQIMNVYTISKRLNEGVFRIQTKDGRSLLWNFYSSYIGRDEHGLKNIISIAVDITHSEQSKKHLIYQSEHDELTGLYNRRYFNKTIKNQGHDPYLLLLSDINNLKLINDLYGHKQGDTLLKYFSDILKKHLPKESIICRLSGDEFAVILSARHYDDVTTLITTIETALKANDILDIEVSSAFGYALRGQEESHEQVFIQAENALYAYKNRGHGDRFELVVHSMLNRLYKKTDEDKDHTNTMVHHAAKMADALALNEQDKRELIKACELHDIGKIKVDSIGFTKPNVSKEQFEDIKKHTEYGYRICNAIAELKPIAFTILTHHENIDGSGYPFGLTKDDIPLSARIIRIIDSYDVMTRHRVYKEKKSKSQAIKELKTYQGSYYDEQLLDTFIALIQ